AKVEKDAKDRYDNDVSEWEQQYSGLKGKIESLLPGALQAGLAHAYQEKRKSEENNLKNGYKSFKWTIGFLILTAFIQLTIIIIWLFVGKDVVSIFKDMPSITLGLLPIFAALIWIGVYQNKSLNLTKKLIEEYFHKEASARTFEGLSKQIEELDDDSELSNELKIKLLNQTLDTAGKNPSDCITNHEKSDNPIFSLMNASSKWVKQSGGTENVAKILGALSTMYAENAEKIKKDCKSEISTSFSSVNYVSFYWRWSLLRNSMFCTGSKQQSYSVINKFICYPDWYNDYLFFIHRYEKSYRE
ncbi:MAG: hypothetical protein LBU68_01785, partial [Rickettsiales bacterium]|nr:hypothetical protein [Rickettsiales bacterium]